LSGKHDTSSTGERYSPYEDDDLLWHPLQDTRAYRRSLQEQCRRANDLLRATDKIVRSLHVEDVYTAGLLEARANYRGRNCEG
jgi:hypothetical protein